MTSSRSSCVSTSSRLRMVRIEVSLRCVTAVRRRADAVSTGASSWGAVSSEMGVSPSSGGAVFSTEAEDSTACSSAAGASAESSFSPCTGASTGAAFFRRGARLGLGGAGSPAVSETVSAGVSSAPSADKLEGVSSSPAADPAGSSESEGAPEAVPSPSGAASSDASVSINSRGGLEPSKVASPSG